MFGIVSLLVLAAPNPYLEQAKEHFLALDFEKCAQRLEQAPQWKESTKDELRDVEVYAALCTFSLGRNRDAAEHFRLALRIDERVELPAYTSPKAVELFLRVKRKLAEPPAPLPESDLPADAPVDTSLTPRAGTAPPPSFIKRHAAPIALSAVAVGALTTGIILGANARGLETRAGLTRDEGEYNTLINAAAANASAANISYAVAAVSAATAIVFWIIQRDP